MTSKSPYQPNWLQELNLLLSKTKTNKKIGNFICLSPKLDYSGLRSHFKKDTILYLLHHPPPQKKSIPERRAAISHKDGENGPWQCCLLSSLQEEPPFNKGISCLSQQFCIGSFCQPRGRELSLHSLAVSAKCSGNTNETKIFTYRDTYYKTYLTKEQSQPL